MKRYLLLFPIIALLSGCQADPAAPLPEPGENALRATLNKANSGLLDDEYSEPTVVALSVPDHEEKYEVVIDKECYAHSDYDEIILKPGAYIQSASNYHVDRLIIDFFSKKGILFDIYASKDDFSEPLESHESTIETLYPNDFGQVLEYEINGNDWTIKNNQEFQKPAFYSITIVFSL